MSTATPAPAATAADPETKTAAPSNDPEIKIPSASELRSAQEAARAKEHQEKIMKLVAECIFVMLNHEPDKQVTITRGAVQFPITDASMEVLKKTLKTAGYGVDTAGDATNVFYPRK